MTVKFGLLSGLLLIFGRAHGLSCQTTSQCDETVSTMCPLCDSPSLCEGQLSLESACSNFFMFAESNCSKSTGVTAYFAEETCHTEKLCNVHHFDEISCALGPKGACALVESREVACFENTCSFYAFEEIECKLDSNGKCKGLCVCVYITGLYLNL